MLGSGVTSLPYHNPLMVANRFVQLDHMTRGRAMLGCGLFVSGRSGAPADHHAVHALAAGCWPIVPKHGVYPELLPPALHGSCLFDGAHEHLASRIMDAWHTERPSGYDKDLGEILSYFDPVAACSAIDQRLEQLVQASPSR